MVSNPKQRRAHIDLTLLWKVVDTHGAVPLRSMSAMIKKQLFLQAGFFLISRRAIPPHKRVI